MASLFGFPNNSANQSLSPRCLFRRQIRARAQDAIAADVFVGLNGVIGRFSSSLPGANNDVGDKEIPIELNGALFVGDTSNVCTTAASSHQFPFAD